MTKQTKITFEYYEKTIYLSYFFIVTLSSTNSYGQKCKWKTEEIDPISEMKFLESKKITQAKTVVVGDEPRSISIQFIQKETF